MSGGAGRRRLTVNALDLERVGYTYPEATHPALDHVDLSVPAGERLLVEGDSGSGKSTLLRTANGLVPHFYGGRFAGRATVMGMDTRTTSPQSLAAQVGMVFQDLPARFLSDSVEDVIAFSLGVGGAGTRVIASRVASIADRMGVARLIGRRLEHLSAGEQARLAIAAALARQPKMLLLDEPVTHIDPAGSQAVVAWVEQLSRQDGVTVLLAEHRVEGWRAMIDRSVRLGEGGRTIDRLAPSAGEPVAGIGGHAPLGRIAPQTLHANGIHVRLGRRPILRGVDLDLAPGELLALVGRNGSGKTTVLRTLVGLERPDAGDITLNGKSIVGGRPSERVGSIGFVPQAPASMLFAETVEQEVMLTLGRQAGGAAEPAAPWLETFGLSEVRLRYPRDLSAGERQRLALAAIMAGRPSVLLLDEPTLGMDRARLGWLGAVLTDLRQAGCAILVATHDPGFVAANATRALLLEDGLLTAEGKAERVLQADPAFAAALTRWQVEAGIIGARRQGDRHADG
jgi:energy-coupling factor transport system ATP-binding protein